MKTTHMKKSILNTVLFLFIFAAFVACEQKTKGESAIDKPTDTPKPTEITSAQQKMEEFEGLDMNSFELVKSLRWEESIGENSKFLEVDLYLNADKMPVKIVEYFSDGNFAEQGERIYYLDQSEVYAITKRYDDWVDSNFAVFNEKQVFFEGGNAAAARFRSSDYAEDIVNENWKNIRPENISNETVVMDLINGKGRFQTHYISYIEANESLFLLLGEPKEGDRFVTVVKVEQPTPFIKELITNSKKHKFKPIDIEFVVTGGSGQPEFRVLKNAKWAVI
jgi:PBP1b-binding outer membrane lipoprotein LpoB